MRQSLLQPPSFQKIERFSLALGQLPDLNDGVTRFEAKPQIIFRPERLAYAAGLPMTTVQKFLLDWLSWVAFPWYRIETYEPIDEIPDEQLDAMSADDFAKIEDTATRIRFRWYRPIFELVQGSMQRAQTKALRGVVVKSISIDGVELLVQEVPLEMFSALAVGMHFHAPTCKSDRLIRIVTSKTSVPLTFIMQGAGASG